MSNNNNNNYTTKVKIKLLSNNITITDLAKEIGYSRGAVSREINGKTHNKKLRDKINSYLNINTKEKQ